MIFMLYFAMLLYCITLQGDVIQRHSYCYCQSLICRLLIAVKHFQNISHGIAGLLVCFCVLPALADLRGADFPAVPLTTLYIHLHFIKSNRQQTVKKKHTQTHKIAMKSCEYN